MKLAMACLFAMALLEAAGGQVATPVVLNHAFVVPDEATYQAVVNSTFMREEFGAFESRTTVRKDMTYTGLYWYGTNTYFELLQPSPRQGPPNGIAFGVESAGGLQALIQQGVPGQIYPVTRQAEGKDVNWFHMLGIDTGTKNFPVELFVIEYEPDFLKNWYANLPPSSASIRRGDVLTRYAAKVDRLKQRETGLLHDVSAIHLVLTPDQQMQFAKVCDQLGFKLSKGTSATCTGPDIVFIIDAPGTGRNGITSVEFRLNHEKLGEQTFRLGSSTLEFSGH